MGYNQSKGIEDLFRVTCTYAKQVAITQKIVKITTWLVVTTDD